MFRVSLAAVALGACIIEKHFTLDKSLPGPDHKASAEPHELGEMIRAIRKVELAIGSGGKRPAVSEMENRRIVRRGLAAAVDIPAGTKIEARMLKALRPATAISPIFIQEILGLCSRRYLKANEQIQWSDFQ